MRFDEEQSLYVDDSGNVYDVQTSSIIGVSDGKGNVRSLKVAEACKLAKLEKPLWHKKEKKRPINKVATKAEIANLLKAMRGEQDTPKKKKKTPPAEEVEGSESIELEGSEEGSESIELEGSEEGSDEAGSEELDIIASTPPEMKHDSGSSPARELGEEELEDEGGIFEFHSSDVSEEEEEGFDDGSESWASEASGTAIEEDIAVETEAALGETLEDEPEVSEADFARYVEAQYSGKVDMANVPAVAKKSGLAEQLVGDILLNYKALLAKYPKVQTQAMLKAKKGAGRGGSKGETTQKKTQTGGKRRLLKKKN